MIAKLAIFVTSMCAGIFALHASEAIRRHDWGVGLWEGALAVGWSIVAWHQLRKLK